MIDTCPVSAVRSDRKQDSVEDIPFLWLGNGSVSFCSDVTSSLLLTPHWPEQVT